MSEQPTHSYAAAGVDVAAGELAVTLMKEAVQRTHRPEVLGGFGGFAGLFDVSALTTYRRPLLATSTDGVGTKVALAQQLDVHDTIGQDLVAMVVDDLIVCGAEPLFMTDYIATGSVVPERIAAIVSGIARGCELAGCALLGGETAEHPGLLAPDEYDVAGAGVGVVEADELRGADRVRHGDAVVALASSGLHSNGYSLVRYVLLEQAGLSLTADIAEFSRTLGEELLEPTRIYTSPILQVLRSELGPAVHAMSHITGGGLAANIARVLPEDCHVDVDRSTWSPAPIFRFVQDHGVAQAELEQVLNMGIGMVAIVAPEQADAVCAAFEQQGIASWVAGTVRQRNDGELGDAPAKGGAQGQGAGSTALVSQYASLN